MNMWRFLYWRDEENLDNQAKRVQGCRQTAAFGRSVVVEHAWQEGHEINWNDVEILDTAKDLRRRKVKETLHQDGPQDLLDE